MLRELTGRQWQRILGISDERIPRALILRGTRNLKSQAEIYRRYFDDVLEVGSPNGLIEEVFVGKVAGAEVGYASVYGAAMASEVTHLFGALGTKLVVQTGCCGAWADGVRVGDLFVPTRAFCGEGAAQYYVGAKSVVGPTLQVGEAPGSTAFLRTPREEHMMCETFGEQYRDYMRRTGRLLPRVKTEGVAGAQEEN